MAEFRWSNLRRLGRFLPGGVRRDVFEPALHDLHHDQLSRGAAGDGRRQVRFLRFRDACRVVLLFVDCWRTALVPAQSSLGAPVGRASLKVRVSRMWNDVRYAVRQLTRERAFALAAILTLTLGVGANVAVFAVVEAVLLRPLPYASAGDLVILNHRDERTGITKEFIAIGDFVDLAARPADLKLEGLAAFGYGPVTIYGDGEPVRVTSLQTGPGLLELLRVRPALGRFITADDTRPGAAPVVVLGQSLWRSMFNEDAAAIGRRIRIGQADREIIGVAPDGFHFPATARTGLILPFTLPIEAPAARKSGWVFAAGRLKAGATIDGVTSQLTTISQQLEQQHPRDNQGSRYFVRSLRDALVGDTKRPLMLLGWAVGAVLVIACVNVGNLLLVRALGRRPEMAMRVALGASRSRLAGQLVVESLVLALVAAAGGVLVAYWATPALVALVPRSVNVPGLAEAGLNLRVLTYALGVSVAAAVLFGVVSAIAMGTPAAAALAGTSRAGVSRRVRRFTSALVVAEIALAVVLLLGAGLVLRSFARLLAVDPGFKAERVAAFDVALPSGRYPDGAARSVFFQRALAAARVSPGIEAVGAAVVTPLTGNNWTVPFERIDRPVPPGERPPDVGWQSASGGYFAAIGIPLRSGRLFDERDGPTGPPAVIVSEAIERRYFPGESAVGRFVKTGGPAPAEIVGVVGDIRRAALAEEPRPDMYFPFERQPGNAITIFARTSGDPAAALPVLADAFRRIEPNVVVSNGTTLAETAAQSIGTTRLTLWLLGLFGVIALALAAVGIYGVLSHAVRLRTHEIGTRLALGATPADIVRLVLGWGGALAAAGAAAGVAIGIVAARSLGTLLYGVSTYDPLPVGVAAAMLVVTALAASFIPARRASKTDPARTLSLP